MRALSYINKYFRKYKWKLFLGILITIMARIFSLILPPFINKAVARVEEYVKFGGDITLVKSQLIEYILIILATALLSGFFVFLMRQTIIRVSRHIEYDLKNEIYNHYQKLPLSFYKKNRTGDLMNRISEDVAQVRMYAGPAIMYGMQTLTLFTFLIPIMFIKAPTLTLYSLIPLPILSILIYQISKLIYKKSMLVQEFLSQLSVFSQETFSGISVLKSYGIEFRIQKEVKELSEEGRQKAIDLAKVNVFFFPLMVLLIGISNIIVIYIGGQQYLRGELETIGIIAEFILYVNMLTWPVAIVGWVTSILQRAEVSQKRINEFLQEPPTIKNTADKKSKIKGNIRFEEVSFTYKETGIQALNKVSFEIFRGETVAIIGKTGSGKTTILELLTRLYDVDFGTIIIDGLPIQKHHLTGLRESIGIVPQDIFLFSDTIENNIHFGKRNATSEQIQEVAKQAVLNQEITKFNNGYQTVLGERGVTLSGGQKQRVAIARTLLKDPTIFLFDDCLSAVDTETEEKILKNFENTLKDKTAIIVSHRISFAKNADKIIVLDKGRVIQQGTHLQLIKLKGYYQDLYQAQISQKEI